MSLTLATGIYTRWNDAGLDTSVGTLHWGTTAPESDTLPRSVYTIPSDKADALTRGTQIRTATVRFQIWAATPELAAAYGDSVKAAFHNADAAGTSPLDMTGGEIIECLTSQRSVEQEEESVYQQVVEFVVRYTEVNSTPS